MVTNGGYNGIVTALSNGVPVIAHGAQSDKPEICARVAWSGAGLRLPGERASAGDVARSVARVLADSAFRSRARELAVCFGRYDAGARSAELLEQLATTRQPVLRREDG